ncbi:hypothetical protein [Peterkaempfera bronchialis]|uniref:hypothetical protein n=1 Tax=Peterkaempfera bronchialis TaxID=2126346 RepID=UPI001E2A79C8|nr:hypothetical protein [Peterkaempfera bronchialis]
MNLTTRTGGVQRRTPAPYLRRAAAAEWEALWSTVCGRLAGKRLGAVPLALTATSLVLLFDLVQQLPGGVGLVERVGVVRGSQPLELSLLRTPLSLFVPALDLPVWGALAQVLVVFGIAEIVLGRRQTLCIAYAGTLAGTLYARLAVDLGPDSLFGLPASAALVRDSGPSAAVVALAICTAWRARAWCTGAAVAVVMAAEAAMLPNLAGLEHLAAVATAVLTAAVGELFGGYWPRVLALVRASADTARPTAGALTP